MWETIVKHLVLYFIFYQFFCGAVSAVFFHVFQLVINYLTALLPDCQKDGKQRTWRHQLRRGSLCLRRGRHTAAGRARTGVPFRVARIRSIVVPVTVSYLVIGQNRFAEDRKFK